ncbi:MAG TPA: arsenite methyltransferase [Anaerolineae bacterium]|nr:arsenite methyltransferase [Anaerolineae bacterium]
MDEQLNAERIKEAVRDTYGGIARRFGDEPQRPAAASCCGPAAARETSSGCCGPAAAREASSGCCGPSPAGEKQSGCCGPSQVAETGAARFYAPDELVDLPESVTEASLGCGNPLAIAALQPGEVVLDLGSGGGIDCFLAARKVGPEGRVIGLDMTPDMIKLARRNAKRMGMTNVDFRFGEMEEMPLPDDSVDVVISNCVINLSPDKDAVFAEAYRVLRPGGRLSVSDMVVDGDLPQYIRDRLDAWAGCVAGALDERVYLDKMRAAGFERVEVSSRVYATVDEVAAWDDVQVIAAGADGEAVEALLAEARLSPAELARRVASIKVTAHKPA